MEENFDLNKLFAIRKIYNKYINEHSSNNKSVAGFVIFAEAINRNEFHSQQELSDYVGCNKAHTSRTILKMQIKGLIKPVCSRNKTLFELTEKGKEFALSAQENRKKLFEALFDNVHEKDIETFFKVIDQVCANAETIANR